MGADWQFWTAAGAMVLAVVIILLRSLQTQGKAALGKTTSVLVYRDQLAEIDRDLGRGVLAPDEAERMRLEVARRLLQADKGSAEQGLAEGRGPVTLVGGSVTVVLGGAVAVYLWLGAPGEPDLPLATQIALAEARRAARPDQVIAEALVARSAPVVPDPSFAALMDRLRAAVAARPDDRTGLRLLARNEAALGNLEAARTAQNMLIAAMGDDVDAQTQADLAELMIASTNGYVSPEAEAVLTKALTLDPNNGTARFYAGEMMAQVGRFDLAFRMWRPLVDGPADAPFMAALRQRLPEVAARAGIAFDLPALRGPSAADIAAADDLSPEAREQMIAGMVTQLSDRLARDGGPAADWAQLITALQVLGDTEGAKNIIAEALVVFAADPAAIAMINEAAGTAP